MQILEGMFQTFKHELFYTHFALMVVSRQQPVSAPRPTAHWHALLTLVYALGLIGAFQTFHIFLTILTDPSFFTFPSFASVLSSSH